MPVWVARLPRALRGRPGGDAAAGAAGDDPPDALARGIGELTPAEATVRGFDELAKHLRVGLLSLTNTLGPDRVVLSGLLAPIAHRYGELLDRALTGTPVALLDPVTLSVSTLEDAVLLGAAEFALDPLFADPAGTLAALGGAVAAPAR